MTNPDPQLLSMAHESVWKGNARRKLAEDIAADLMRLGAPPHREGESIVLYREGMYAGTWTRERLADRIEKHLMGAMR